MGIEVGALAIVGLGFQAASFVMQQGAQDDAEDAARAQAQATREAAQAQRDRAVQEQKRADIQNARTLRSAIRQARIARAAVVNAGANSGTAGSSAVLGGVGSIDSQLASNMGTFNQLTDVNQKVMETQVRESNAAVAAGSAAADYQIAQGEASQWGALGGLGSSIFKDAGGFKTIFSS